MRWKTRLVAAAGCAAALSLAAPSAFAQWESTAPPNPGLTNLWGRPFIPLWVNNYSCLNPNRNEHSPYPKWLQDAHCVELPSQSYLSFGGRMRFNWWTYTNPQAGLAAEAGAPPGSTPFWAARTPDGRSAAAANPNSGFYNRSPYPHHNTMYQSRIAPYADLHLFNEKFRVFFQLADTREWQNNWYDPSGESKTEVAQLFADFELFNFNNAGGKAILRAGRAEAPIPVAGGNLTAREGPNVRASYDGFKFDWKNKEGYEFTAFAYKPVTLNPHVQVIQANGNSWGIDQGAFDDSSDNHTHIYGVIGTVPWMGKAFSERFYVMNRNMSQVNPVSAEAGGGTAIAGVSAPLAMIALGHPSGENRFLGGTKLFGAIDNFHYDYDFMYEWGHLGPKEIQAWGFIGETGYTFKQVMFQPDVSLQTIAMSGGHYGDNKVRTFDALYPSNGFYFGDGDFLTLSNVVAIGPTAAMKFSPEFLGGPSILSIWRQTSADALYAAAVQPYAGSANYDGKHMGMMYGGFFSWRPAFAPYFTANMEYTFFDVAGGLKAAGGRDSQSIWVSANFMF